MDSPYVSRHYMTELWTWYCTRCGARGQHDDHETAELDAQTHPCRTPDGWTRLDHWLLRRHVATP